MKKNFIILFTLLFCSDSWSSFCDSPLEGESLREAQVKCRLKQAASNAGTLSTKVEKEIAFNEFCQFRSEGGEKGQDILCQNPAEVVCSFSGRVLDSNCNYSPGDNEIMINEQDVKNKFCNSKEANRERVETLSGKKKCNSLNLKGNDCVEYLNFLSKGEVHNDFNEKIFTEKKVDKLFNVGELVKEQYLSLIEKSKNLSKEKKKILKSKIKRTRIHLNQDRFNNPELFDCYGSSNGKLSNGVFNQEDPFGGNEIHICSGLAINMDHMNPHALIHIIAHEFSHSIDPCALEVGFNGKKSSYDAFYPELVNCLRGTKDGTCKKAELNCTGKGEVKRYCKSMYPAEWRECHKALSGAPSCVVGGHRGEFEHGKQEQINEGFADYMASEVMGEILKEANSQERADALLSISSQISRRHDGCNKGPRKDSHPNAYIRLNKILMSSEKGRAAFNCSASDKKTCIGI